MDIRSWTGLNIRKLFPVWFLLLVISALINWIFLSPTGNIIIDSYFNDLVSVPLMLYSSSIIMGFIYGRIPYYLNLQKIILAIFALAITFEFVLPKYRNHGIADPWDVLAYSIGGIFFYLIQSKNSVNQ